MSTNTLSKWVPVINTAMKSQKNFSVKMASRYLTTLEDQKVVAVQEVEELA